MNRALSRMRRATMSSGREAKQGYLQYDFPTSFSRYMIKGVFHTHTGHPGPSQAGPYSYISIPSPQAHLPIYLPSLSSTCCEPYLEDNQSASRVPHSFKVDSNPQRISVPLH